MKLSDWASVAEITSGVAIVVTLVVLVMEVRGNTAAIRAQTAQATFGASTESFYYAEGNAALARAVTEGLEALTPEERAHSDALIAAIFNSYSNNYYQYQQGNLDEEIHAAFRSRLQALLSNPIYLERWESARALHIESFRRYVDEIVESMER